MIFLDTETSGLSPYADELVMVGVAFDDGGPLALRHPEDADLIQRVLDLGEAIVGHNLTFDLGFLACNGYRVPDLARCHDTVLIAHVAGERKPGQTELTRLQRQLVAAGELPATILEPEERLKAWLRTARRAARKAGARAPQKGNAPAALLRPYLFADVTATRAVARHWGALVNGQADVLELERRCIPAIFSAERRGIPLDLDAARELRDHTEATVGDLRAELFQLAGHVFNPNSARQLEVALVGRGVDASELPRTPKAGNIVLRTDVVEGIENELAATWTKWRAEKQLHDYVCDLWKHAYGGRLYGTFRQLGADTGRMSSARPNLQNIPKSDLRVRYCIAAGEGKVLVGADLDNVELRTLAALAGDGGLSRAFARGVDVHQQTADALGISRDDGKTLNFATIYGAGARLIAERLGCSQAEARAILNRWFAQYPEVRRLRSRLWRLVQRQGYLETVGGRRHYWPKGPDHKLLNRIVSGSCADMFKAAAIELHAAGVEVVLYVHDEVLAEADEDEAEATAALLEEILPRPMERGGIRVDGLKATAAIHGRWSDFKQPEWSPWTDR
jgi:DNA polymerase I-like protein with 3'-5' exonuclease and polymerase domains